MKKSLEKFVESLNIFHKKFFELKTCIDNDDNDNNDNIKEIESIMQEISFNVIDPADILFSLTEKNAEKYIN
jgi:hypothetical protein